ncbi:MAG: DUF1573 domain-containing protein [Armatimonadetes bacterium]|nr:DUF1573 domain-containing protein [Armatimonadota bacterium]
MKGISVKNLGTKERNILCFLCFFVAISFLNSEPFISFEKFEHNFGNIKEEEVSVEYDFIFSNTGDKPLKLIDVETS